MLYLPEEPRAVDVWSFSGQDPLEVVGVRGSPGTFHVFTARHVSTAEEAEELDALGDSSANREQ